MSVPARTAEGLSYKNVPIQSRGGGGALMPQTFGDVVAFSEIMARSQHAIPQHLRNVPGACLAVTMQALRWEMDPFAVASKSYSVKDIIAYEAQLIAAVVHTRAPIKARPEYAYTGEGPDRRCAVTCEFDDGVRRSYESPRIADIAVKNSPLWKADPDQQLGYYSIRAFARRYCPEVILGVYTPEEAQQFHGPDRARDVTPMKPISQRIAEIDGNGETEYPKEASGTAREAPSTGSGTPDENQDVVIQSVPPLQSETEVQRDAADEQRPPAPSGDEPRASDQESSGDGSGEVQDRNESTSPPDAHPLPKGWEMQYAAALKRATKPESLQKLASQFWNLHGGWAAHKNGDNGPTAVAIFDAFTNHFTNKEVRDAILREVNAA